MRAVRLRRDKIVVALEHKVLMYNFADLRLEHSTETLANPHGLAALSPAPEHNVLACPGLHCGQARWPLETPDTVGASLPVPSLAAPSHASALSTVCGLDLVYTAA